MNQKKKKKEKNTIVDSYGCVRWDSPFPINETDEMIPLLTDTCFWQRRDINKGLKMDNLVKEWPFLFVDIGMLHHFKLLTDIDIMNALEQSMTLKGKEKISFLGSC